MSNFGVILICFGFILLSWLIRRYQDGKSPFTQKSKGIKTESATVANTKVSLKKTKQVFKSMQDPSFVIKNNEVDLHNDFERFYGVVQKVCTEYELKTNNKDRCTVTNNKEQIVAIIEYKPQGQAKKHAMGTLVHLVYTDVPNKRTLQKDYQALATKS